MEVLVFVPRMGVGVGKIPVAASARNPPHPAPKLLGFKHALAFLCSFFQCLVHGHQGHREAEDPLRELVRGMGSLG